jgi:hypothetical protein
VFDTEPPRKAAAPIIPRESTDEAPRARLDPRLNEPPMLELKEARWQPKEPRS